MSEQNENPLLRTVALSQDALVDQLRPSPTDPAPDVVKIRGFLGRDTADGYWRLYLDAGLNTYVRIAEADILAREQEGANDRGLKCSLVAIKADTVVEKVKAAPLNAQTAQVAGCANRR